MFGPGSQELLGHMPFEGAYKLRVESLRGLLEVFDREVAMVEAEVHHQLAGHRGYRAVQALHGVGPIKAAIFVAEIGDVGRFPSARHLCSWAGMTPKLHESDLTSHRGKITKQGSTIVRWAAVESVVRYHGGEVIAPAYNRIAERRGKMIARVAAGRRLLTLVYYGLRDGESVAWAERPLEPARAQPGRELDPCRGPPASGVADYLSEPVWLWPEHTMRTKREGMAGNRASVCPPQMRPW